MYCVLKWVDLILSIKMGLRDTNKLGNVVREQKWSKILRNNNCQSKISLGTLLRILPFEIWLFWSFEVLYLYLKNSKISLLDGASWKWASQNKLGYSKSGCTEYKFQRIELLGIWISLWDTSPWKLSILSH